MAFGIWNEGEWPPFSSYICFEVFEDDVTKAREVRIVYNGVVKKTFSLEEFIGEVERLVPHNWQQVGISYSFQREHVVIDD